MKVKMFSIFAILSLLGSCKQEFFTAAKTIKEKSQKAQQKKTYETDDDSIFRAIESNDENLLEGALDEDSNVDYHFSTGETPLTMSLIEAKPALSVIILKHVKDFQLRNKNNESPLHLIAQNNKVTLLNIFIENNVHLDARNSLGDTPLKSALRKGHDKLATYLIINGANVLDEDLKNFVESNLNLHKKKNLKSTMVLLNFIENLDSREVDKETFYKLVKNGHVDCLKYLFINQESRMLEFISDKDLANVAINHIDSSEKKVQTLSLLLKYGLSPNTFEQEPPLLNASKKGLKVVVMALVKKGASLTYLDNNEKSALDYAVINLDLEMVKKLKSLFKDQIQKAHKQSDQRKEDDLRNVLIQSCHQQEHLKTDKKYEETIRQINRVLGCTYH